MDFTASEFLMKKWEKIYSFQKHFSASKNKKNPHCATWLVIWSTTQNLATKTFDQFSRKVQLNGGSCFGPMIRNLSLN